MLRRSSKSLRGEEAHEASDRQAAHKTKGHEATSSLGLVRINPLHKAHHAAAAQIAVCDSEQQLHHEEVEKVGADRCSLAAYIAEQVQGYKCGTCDGEEEENLRVRCQAYRWYGGAHSSEQVANVPEEEAKRNECCRLEQATRRVWLAHAEDGLCEDWEEHGDYKGQKHGTGQPRELFEQVDQRYALALGGCWSVEFIKLNSRAVHALQVEKGRQRDSRDDGGCEEVGESGGAGLLRRAINMLFLRSDGQYRDNLSDARQHSSNALACHDALRVLFPTKASNVGKDAILA